LVDILEAASEYSVLNGDNSWLVILGSDEVPVNYTVHHVYFTAWTQQHNKSLHHSVHL